MLLLAPASVFYLAQTRPLKETSCFRRDKLSRLSFQAYDAASRLYFRRAVQALHDAKAVLRTVELL